MPRQGPGEGDMMHNLDSLFSQLHSANVHRIILSGPVDAAVPYRKITMSRQQDAWHCEQLTEKQAFHRTVAKEDLDAYLTEAFAAYTQLNAFSEGQEITARVTRKGKLLIGKRRCEAAPPKQAAHNRAKQYLLPEGQIVPPLVDMGVLTPDGRVVKAMYDKFRQINRFLEIIDDVIRGEDIQTLHIVDFGCGKSYLTFVVYYYFTQIRGIPIRMTGVDLKEDVIAFCTGLARKYGYEGLSFVVGDIAAYTSDAPVDMVLSLHACDTATDYAIFNALRWNARYIFAVPCCQHEVAGQISFENAPIFGEYGLVKERLAALLTDTLRADMLAACGYRTQLMEFVDLCHTPKNILIRAQRARLSAKACREKAALVRKTCADFDIQPTLLRLLDGAGMLPTDAIEKRNP